MTSTRPAVSLGPLALILALAIPAGLFSAMSPTTTGELVDASDAIVFGRVASVQRITGPDRLLVELDVASVLFDAADPLGAVGTGRLVVDVEGGAPLHAGDATVAFLSGSPTEALGWLPAEKDVGGFVITGATTGMEAQGLTQGIPVSVDAFAEAVARRRGPSLGGPAGGPAGGSQYVAIAPPSVTGLVDDAYEPNDTLGAGSPLSLAPLNGKLLVTGLNLTRDDVDFFTFHESLPLVRLTAETLPPTGGGSADTVLGVFNAVSGDMLAFDDDDGGGLYSLLDVPLESGGDFAVAVAPFNDSDFDGGGQNASLGPYDLSLQRVLGSYLWNGVDLMAGFSKDGTFLEDAMGFRAIGGPDVLLPDVPADGWSLQYMVERMPSGVTALVFGGAGDQLAPVAFTHSLMQRKFQIGTYIDANGAVRQSLGKSEVAFSHTGNLVDGVGVNHDYRWSKGSATLKGDLTLIVPIHRDITDVLYERVLDVDLFDYTLNEFSWSFDPQSTVQAFAVDTSTVVGGLSLPGSATGGPVTGDMQAAMRIAHGRGGIPFDARTYRTPYPMAFTFVLGKASNTAAHDAARDNLTACRMETWVVAVGQDPDDGTWAAFGVGLSEP